MILLVAASEKGTGQTDLRIGVEGPRNGKRRDSGMIWESQPKRVKVS